MKEMTENIVDTCCFMLSLKKRRRRTFFYNYVCVCVVSLQCDVVHIIPHIICNLKLW